MMLNHLEDKGDKDAGFPYEDRSLLYLHTQLFKGITESFHCLSPLKVSVP
jgi:hypothetical protein